MNWNIREMYLEMLVFGWKIKDGFLCVRREDLNGVGVPFDDKLELCYLDVNDFYWKYGIDQEDEKDA